MYVWALCRDQSIYDHKTAWRVMEFAIQHTGKLLCDSCIYGVVLIHVIVHAYVLLRICNVMCHVTIM